MKITGIACVLAGGLTAIALAFAQDAHADESTYMDFLHSHDIYASTESSVKVGHQICADARAHGADGLDRQGLRALAAGLTPQEGAAIIYGAVSQLCPDMMDMATAWSKS